MRNAQVAESGPSEIEELERIAMASLAVARLLMEAGAGAEVVHGDCSLVGMGLGPSARTYVRVMPRLTLPSAKGRTLSHG